MEDCGHLGISGLVYFKRGAGRSHLLEVEGRVLRIRPDGLVVRVAGVGVEEQDSLDDSGISVRLGQPGSLAMTNPRSWMCLDIPIGISSCDMRANAVVHKDNPRLAVGRDGLDQLVEIVGDIVQSVGIARISTRPTLARVPG